MRSMRVARPRKRSPSITMATNSLRNSGSKFRDRRVGRDRLQPRHHHVLDRVARTPCCCLPHRQQRREHVALVDQADDALAFDHRQLRHIGRAHARERRAQGVARLHRDRAALVIAVDDDVAHGADVLAIGPAFLRQERIVEHLREIFRPGIAHQADDALGLALLAAEFQRGSEQRARRTSRRTCPPCCSSSRAAAKLSGSLIE